MTAHYTLIIGDKELSSWSLRPYLALRATGAAFDEIVIRLDRPETKAQIAKHTPSGKVPVLKIGENGGVLTVFDSLAICETLAERHPDAHLWPADPSLRARARAYACEMHSAFAPLRKALPMAISSKKPTPELNDDVNADIARIMAAWSDALTANAANGGFLFGQFSVADCMYAPVVTRFATYGIALPALLQAYSERVFALPAMRDWIAAAKEEIGPQAPTAIL